MGPGAHEFLLAPLVATGVVALLVLVARWVLAPGRAVRPRPDYGLLVPVATAADPAGAERLRARLARHGIRGTTAAAGAGYDAHGRAWPPSATFVLVFPRDVERARPLVRPQR